MSRSHIRGLAFSERVYRLLFLFFPADFRRAHATDAQELFRDRYREEFRRRGSVGIAVLWLRTLRDLLQHAFLERLDALLSRIRRTPVGGGDPPDVPVQKATIGDFMESIASDIRYALRTIRRSPGVVLIAVISLGIGIGANAAIFSAVDVFMFRPLPYPDAEQLVDVHVRNDERGWMQVSQSIPDFLDIRADSKTLEAAGSYGSSFNLATRDRPERVRGERVSWNLFQVLRTQPALGRSFTPEEEQDGNRVAIVSDGLWNRHFGHSPDVLGETLFLDGEAYTLVGVMPPKFWLGQNARIDVWVPFGLTGEEQRGSHFISVTSRMRPEYTIEEVRAELGQIASRLQTTYPESNANNYFGLITLHEEIFNTEFRMGSAIASVAVAFVLLIACANVANLMLTRAAGREREIALRGALGAGRIRIVRQLLTESMLIALLGGALGVGVAVLGIKGLVSVMPAAFPRVNEIALDGRVLMYTAFVSLFTGVLFGIAPALQSSRPNLTSSLKEGGRSGPGAKGVRLRKALVVAEVSLALVLLVSSTLLVKGFVGLRGGDFGFNTANVLTMHIDLPTSAYPDDDAERRLYDDLRFRIRALPGVEAAAGTNILPLDGGSSTSYLIPGEEDPGEGRRPIVQARIVFPGYFDVMDIDVTRGRAFDETDRPDSRRVAVINEAMAERHWPSDDPIGKQIEIWDETRTIVGVVEGTRNFATWDGGSQPIRPMVFFPNAHESRQFMSLTIKAGGDPTTIANAVRSEVARIDPNLPVFEVRTMQEVVDINTQGATVMAKIMAVLAGAALILAIVGVYGVMAYSVSQRTQEMGIRMALGAGRRTVMGMVVRQGMTLALLGVAAGVAVALAVTRSLSVFLYGVNPFDPVTFAGVSVVLLLAGVTATYLPARRATKVDPLEALRSE